MTANHSDHTARLRPCPSCGTNLTPHQNVCHACGASSSSAADTAPVTTPFGAPPPSAANRTGLIVGIAGAAVAVVALVLVATVLLRTGTGSGTDSAALAAGATTTSTSTSTTAPTTSTTSTTITIGIAPTAPAPTPAPTTPPAPVVSPTAPAPAPALTATIEDTCLEGGCDDLGVRASPTRDSARLGANLGDGDVVRVVCATRGQTRANGRGESSDWWFLIASGGYVPAVFTNVSSNQLPPC